MKHTIGVIALSAALIGGFAAIGAYFHELSGAASYDVTEWRGAATQQGQVSAQEGAQLFNTRGACLACHSIGSEGVGIRGPNLGVLPPDFTEPMVVRAATIQDGMTAVEHLVQAFYDPDAYVGPGFEPGIMNAVNAPPTMLSDEEIRSIILYLYQQGGVPVTPELEEEIAEAQRAYSTDPEADSDSETSTGTASAPSPSEERLAADADRGRERFTALECSRCHTNETTPEGAAVSELGDGRQQHALLVHIARHEAQDPDGVATAYGALLTVQDTADLAAFLAEAAESSTEATEP